MKQQVMIEPGKITFREIPIPELKENEVLIKIMRIGVCGSDIHVYYGKHPYTSYPITQGHEVSGIIEKVGSKVTELKTGDKVTIQPQVVCGKCHSCLHGNYHICDELKVMGFQTTGMASEFFVTDLDRILKLPDDMSFEQGAMIEPMAVACGVFTKTDDLNGLNVVVLGAGPIGNLTAQTAKALGAKSVLITDVSDFRLEIAKKVGIDYTINPLMQNLSEEIVIAFGPDKADLIIECVGINQTINDAIANARKGTDIVLVGVFGDKPTVDLGTVQDRELRLIGMLMYQTKEYLKAIELVSSGKIQLEPLMTKHFKFEDYDEAYQYIENKKDKAMKIFIDIN
ncbi:MAG: alcohol dehydrogenase catalytic domain-containing protein [Candidatus Heimdallarchaeota archaeon]|nr:alcohol dehydrogenase catalytic domain-containing protein [Candidatus Heimdallarchaeota archaeon]MCG3252791.1 alcohol dehydrogenase catalytic domain-containing protein [Candidatus Heimdallarchaeota archaeon]MCK4289928.1 alcohol dehydrogenase catalytic domain-containing protein [Candidatus Heimdallarchaeota archaeon]